MLVKTWLTFELMTVFDSQVSSAGEIVDSQVISKLRDGLVVVLRRNKQNVLHWDSVLAKKVLDLDQDVFLWAV